MILLLVGCAPVDPPAPTATPTLASYTADCEAALGPIPDIDCDRSVEVEVTVTDPETGDVRVVRGPEDLEDGTCDAPSWISGCNVGSRVGSGRNAQGAVFHWICRKNGPDTPDGLYDDIALLGQDPLSGATCFWGAPADGARRPGVLPRPGSADDDGYWADLPALADLRCRDCHDNDPVLVTPWIRPSGVIDSDPTAPFELLGAELLDPYTPGAWMPGRVLVHPDAAACTGCHLLTNRFTCELAALATGTAHRLASTAVRSWPRDHWMDTFDPAALLAAYPTEADWDAVYGPAVAAIDGCCAGELPNDRCWAARD